MPVTTQWNGRKAEAALDEGIRQGLSAVAIQYQSNVKQSMKKGTGRLYKKPGGRVHQASKPGRPPAVDTGTYRRSIQVDLSSVKGPRPVARVGTNDKRGPWLEFGTRFMAARPHFRPILERSKKQLAALFRGVVLKTIRGRLPK